jgi:hypothetical protein
MKYTFFTILTLVAFSSFSQGKFFGGSGDGFATATISNIVLPLEVTGFTVAKNGNAIKATVMLQSTDAVCEILLEVSTDGNTFRAVDSLSAVFPGLQDSQFGLSDLAPSNGINYYRVKIIRCSDSYVYTKILLYREHKAHQFYTSGKTLYYTLEEKGSLEIFNAVGQLIMRRSLQSGAGMLSMDELTTGVYFLRFEQQPVKAIVINE